MYRNPDTVPDAPYCTAQVEAQTGCALLLCANPLLIARTTPDVVLGYSCIPGTEYRFGRKYRIRKEYGVRTGVGAIVFERSIFPEREG